MEPEKTPEEELTAVGAALNRALEVCDHKLSLADTVGDLRIAVFLDADTALQLATHASNALQPGTSDAERRQAVDAIAGCMKDWLADGGMIWARDAAIDPIRIHISKALH